VKIVHPWLSELVSVPPDVEEVAREIALRGFEVASVETDGVPVIDFGITANRPDCLSHFGIAREAATIWGGPFRLPEMIATEEAGSDLLAGSTRLDVRLEDEILCPRYCAQVFEVALGPSPRWLAERLEAAGVRPINSVVDVTNYVMLELGQPMHAFDLDRLEGRTLVIRRARPGERLTTLDGVDRALDPEMLIIADASRAAAVGGVMGGRDSEIGPGTTRIALESACFLPASVRRTSKRLGLKTEASIRFERGADIDAAPAGIARAAALFRQIGAGRPIGGLIDRYPSPRPSTRVTLHWARIAHVLGMDVPQDDVTRILTPLGFEVEWTDAERRALRVGVPTFRVDVTREIDLIEEVGRHYGFDRLPVTFPALTAPQPPPDKSIARDRSVRRTLHAAGFSEAVTFAFIERQAALPFCDPGVEPAAIANPLSEKFAVLRPSLLPGLVDACVHNRRRERRDVRLFETGSRFTGEGEGRAAAFAWCGAAAPAHWSGQQRAVDFFDAKGIMEALAEGSGLTVEYVPVERPFLAPGRAAEARVVLGAATDVAVLGAATDAAASAGTTRGLGVVGQLLPAVAEARGFPAGEEIYVGEIDLALVVERAAEGASDDFRAAPLPRFPSIVRDISILIDESLPAAAVRGTIRSEAPDTLASIAEFDRYQGKGVPEGRISLSLRLTFRAPDRTLTDEEAQAATERIVEALRAAHGAERR
jgi:phenylalanyl-tRNA synthetase beta chain